MCHFSVRAAGWAKLGAAPSQEEMLLYMPAGHPGNSCTSLGGRSLGSCSELVKLKLPRHARHRLIRLLQNVAESANALFVPTCAVCKANGFCGSCLRQSTGRWCSISARASMSRHETWELAAGQSDGSPVLCQAQRCSEKLRGQTKMVAEAVSFGFPLQTILYASAKVFLTNLKVSMMLILPHLGCCYSRCFDLFTKLCI